MHVRLIQQMLLKTYMKDYPDAVENNVAVKKMHAVAFEKAKQANTIKAFDDFIVGLS